MKGLCKSEVVKVWRADEVMQCVSVYMCAVITVGVGHVLLSVKRPDPSTSPPTLTLAHSEGRERERPITNTRLVFLTHAHTHSHTHEQHNHLHLYRPLSSWDHLSYNTQSSRAV